MTFVKGTVYIPRKVVLGGGYVVIVNKLKPTLMIAKHKGLYDAIWSPDERSLDINARLSPQRKWWVFSKTMLSVVESWSQWLVNQGLSRE